MNCFLDKVGLQHFVEKVKNLLSGYLPLSGGTMTGDIVYANKATLNGDGFNYEKSHDTNATQSSFEADSLQLMCIVNHSTY